MIRRDIKCLHRMINCPNALIRQCILNAYYNANSLIGYKLAYFRSSFGIDIFNCDIMSSIEKSKPNVLLDEQQAQVNCLYTLCKAKSSHLKMYDLRNDEINYTIEFITLVNACFCIQCLHLPYYYGYMFFIIIFSNVLISICVYTIVYE